jgi:hypothetical protein
MNDPDRGVFSTRFLQMGGIAPDRDIHLQSLYIVLLRVSIIGLPVSNPDAPTWLAR